MPVQRTSVLASATVTPVFVGADPGMNGAIGIIDQFGRVLAVLDMPIVTVKQKKPRGKTKKRRHLDASALITGLRDALHQRRPVLGALEYVHSMPQQGIVTTSVMMRAFGMLEMAFAATAIPYELIAPQVWKAVMLPGLAKQGKAASIVQVRRTLPTSQTWVTQAKHDGRAEALLLAEYARRVHSGTIIRV